MSGVISSMKNKLQNKLCTTRFWVLKNVWEKKRKAIVDQQETGELKLRNGVKPGRDCSWPIRVHINPDCLLHWLHYLWSQQAWDHVFLQIPGKVFLLPSAPITTSNSSWLTGWELGWTFARQPTPKWDKCENWQLIL